jgi:aromatic ring hydroxylase
MPARSGQQYIEALRKRQPEVYLNGKRVKDVTQEPLFQAPIRAIAEQYDMQLDPAYREVMTYPSPSTGEPVSTSFLVPYQREELVKKRQHFKLRADHNFGFMGRAPDFMNQFVTGWHLMADRFGRAGARFGANATRYYEYVREHDLFLTHMLINPQIDRSKTSAQQEDPFLHLGRVRETSEGIIVRGAKMLGTMAPITEIVQTLAAGGFFYAPSEADLANPDVRPYIDRYVRGRPGVSAEERIALFKLAWDVTGETFAQRMAQYVRFYSGDPLRLSAGFYGQYDKEPLFAIVERALGHRDGEPIPLSPDNPGTSIPYQPGTRGMAGAYAAASLPGNRQGRE